MSLVLQVDILGEYKQLTAATKGAQTTLGQLNKRTKAISNSMNRAFAAIGIGFSLRVITRELEEAGKAAVADAKSMNILALAMENTGKATKTQVAQAEKAINKMQLQAGIADDELRPAYQKLFIATKDVTESNRLLQIAMDASAATGKSLDAVSMAMAKSLAGSDTALVRLIPSLKGAADPMAELEKAFAGAAEAAANTDPYQRMQVVFGEVQEQVGAALLPILYELSTWLATPEGQEKLGELVSLTKDVIKQFAALAGWVVENKDWLVPMVAGVTAVVAVWRTAIAVVGAYRAAVIAAQALSGPVGWATLGAGALGLGIAATASGQGKKTTGQEFSTSFGTVKTGTGKAGTTVVQNITIKGSESAASIAKKIKKAQKATGTKLNAGMF